jgi:methylthioribose-1-phosphate isomerase
VTEPIPPTIEWRRGAVRLLDQRALPGAVRFLRCADVDALCDAIASLAVRGAPALGAAGAYGVALAAHTLSTNAPCAHAARLTKVRPTAVNLAGVRRALAGTRTPRARPLAEAERIAADDVSRNRLGTHGARLIPSAAPCSHQHGCARVVGTARSAWCAAHEQRRRPRCSPTRARPLLQGARLTMGVRPARSRPRSFPTVPPRP